MGTYEMYAMYQPYRGDMTGTYDAGKFGIKTVLLEPSFVKQS